MSIFLEKDDMAKLTGRKIKSLQIKVLSKMGLPFRVNACGEPVVTVAAVEGRRDAAVPATWSPTL